MFGILLESRARRTVRHRFAIASAVAHAAIIAAAAAATAGVPDPHGGDRRGATQVTYVPVPEPVPRRGGAPAQPDHGPATAPLLPIPAVVTRLPDLRLGPIPTSLPFVEALVGDISARAGDDLAAGAAGERFGQGGREPDLPAGSGYTMAQVDRVAALRTSVEPTYPGALRSAGVSGRVIARFVVDTSGRIDPATVEIRESAHEQFSAAVRAILPQLRFTPAMLHGRPVRQLVDLPFEFALRG